MNKKEVLLNLLNSDNNMTYNYMNIEKLVMVMLKDYINKQDKEFIPNYRVDQGFSYDGYAPNGFDGFNGSTAIELKIFRSSRASYSSIYDTIARIAIRGSEPKNLVIIIIGEISEKIKNIVYDKELNVNFQVFLWDINDLIRIFDSNEDLFVETYNNLSYILLKDTISSGIDRDLLEYKKKRENYIKELKKEYKNNNITLFLGAGASEDADIADWDTLISELFIELIDKQLSENEIEVDRTSTESISKGLIKQNGLSPLLQARFLRNSFKGEFDELVSKILYKVAQETSELLKEIGKLCKPNTNDVSIQAVINYNFDDLLERNLESLSVEYRSIYGEGVIPEKNELGIFHVHGFLPKNKDGYENLANSLLVFSEEGYHKLLLEPYNWANITQLNFLINNTCLFIGSSITDPNMRRLLEIATQKMTDGDNNSKHYAFMKRFDIEENTKIKNIQKIQTINESLQESFFKELGLNILWIDEFNEIPAILRQIRG